MLFGNELQKRGIVKLNSLTIMELNDDTRESQSMDGFNMWKNNFFILEDEAVIKNRQR